MSEQPRIDLSRNQIERVVMRFYERVRGHEVLGPVFDDHVSSWDEHEAKIANFWASAILHEGSYSGIPMQVHLAAGNVEPVHFAVWLDLFGKVLHEQLPADLAEAWSHLAHRIGRGLSYGVSDHFRAASEVPRF